MTPSNAITKKYIINNQLLYLETIVEIDDKNALFTFFAIFLLGNEIYTEDCKNNTDKITLTKNIIISNIYNFNVWKSLFFDVNLLINELEMKRDISFLNKAEKLLIIKFHDIIKFVINKKDKIKDYSILYKFVIDQLQTDFEENYNLEILKFKDCDKVKILYLKNILCSNEIITDEISLLVSIASNKQPIREKDIKNKKIIQAMITVFVFAIVILLEILFYNYNVTKLSYEDLIRVEKQYICPNNSVDDNMYIEMNGFMYRYPCCKTEIECKELKKIYKQTETTKIVFVIALILSVLLMFVILYLILKK